MNDLDLLKTISPADFPKPIDSSDYKLISSSLGLLFNAHQALEKKFHLVEVFANASELPKEN